MRKYNVAVNGASADRLGAPKLKQSFRVVPNSGRSTPTRFCILELVSYAALGRRCNPGQNSSLRHLVIPREKKQLSAAKFPGAEDRACPGI